MKILLLTYHYPPDRAVGAIRPAKVVRAFRDAGHEVEVITARLPGETGDLRHEEPGLRVRTVKPWRNPRELYGDFKRWRQAGNRNGTDRGTGPSVTEPASEPASVAAWKRWIFSLLWLPDDQQGFIPAATRVAREEVRKGADLLYTSAPPFSVHLTGYLVKRLTGVKWAAEFRDPWTDNPWKPRHVRSRFSDRAELGLERKSLAAADHIICVTGGIRDSMVHKLPEERSNRVITALNGIDRLLPAAPRPDDQFSVVHVGTLYHKRDPRPFLDALAAVNEAAVQGRDRTPLRVDFIGNCRHFADVSVEAEIRKRGLQSIVHLHDWVPQEEVQHHIEQASLLLLLAQEQPDQVPNKLYEYLGTRIPVLAFADADGETARMLREAGGHFIIADETGAERDAIVARALGLRSQQPVETMRSEVLESWTTERQMQRIMQAVGG